MNATHNHNETQPDNRADNRGRVLRGVGRVAMLLASIALPIVAIIGAAIAGVVMFVSIKHLGETTLVVNAEAAILVAASVTVTLFLLMVTTAALALTGKRRTLLIAGLFTLAWLALAVLMAILDTALTTSRVTIEPTLLLIGSFVYSTLPALPVIPLVTLAISAAHERHEQYPTIASAGGAMLFSVLKVLLTVATFAFESFFGISLGLNPVAAVFAATLNATAFALALGNVDAARHEGDRQGVNTWGAISTGYALLMFVIAIEAILTLSKASGAEGTLAAMHAPQWLETLALWAFVSSIGLSALLIALTFWRKAARNVAAPAIPGDVETYEPVSVVKPTRPALASRAAAQVRTQREALGDLRQALTGDRATVRQPAQIGAAVAKDAPAEPVKVKGRDYDVTGEIIMPNSASEQHNNVAPNARRGRRTASEMGATEEGEGIPKSHG